MKNQLLRKKKTTQNLEMRSDEVMNIYTVSEAIMF